MLDNAFLPPDHNRSSAYFFATILAFLVIILGAYTRLTDAGLGCPDWPACYGHWIPSKSLATTHQAFNATKAWTEMIHRYLAGSLGLFIMGLTLFAFYDKIINLQKPRFFRASMQRQPLFLLTILSLLVIFQALLGKWTVTLKLYPPVVMAHLLGGMMILSLLWWAYLKARLTTRISLKPALLNGIRLWAGISLIILLFQLFLGGLTSANYAALVCLDFPFCNMGQTISFDFFNIIHTVTAGLSTPIGQPLDNATLIEIHMLHRIGALATTIILGTLTLWIYFLIPHIFSRRLSLIILFLLVAQVALGITNILALLPIDIAVTHNAVACLLLLAVITLNYYFYCQSRSFL